MTTKAYIINTGVISAIGRDTGSNYAALKNGQDGIGTTEYLDTFWKSNFPLAEVKYSNQALAALIAAPATWPRTALLSGVAVKECLQAFPDLVQQFKVGFFSGNTVGGMDLMEQVYPQFKTHLQTVPVSQYQNHECGSITALVAQHFHLQGFATTISTACSSSANTIMMAAQMIEQGMIDVAIAGGADALSKFTLNGFNTLMIVDKEKCQPFDEHRRGLNLGEGAGYLLLASAKAVAALGAAPLGYVNGYANANDAFHQTASSPEGRGNQRAMREALKVAGLEPSAIDYINAHGTGTPNNDSAESLAIEAIFKTHVPPFSSTKSFTGHTLGASGGIEAVYSVLSFRFGCIFPNLRYVTPMAGMFIRPQTTFTEGASITHVLSNSFGFGGNCSSLILTKC